MANILLQLQQALALAANVPPPPVVLTPHNPEPTGTHRQQHLTRCGFQPAPQIPVTHIPDLPAFVPIVQNYLAKVKPGKHTPDDKLLASHMDHLAQLNSLSLDAGIGRPHAAGSQMLAIEQKLAAYIDYEHAELFKLYLACLCGWKEATRYFEKAHSWSVQTPTIRGLTAPPTWHTIPPQRRSAPGGFGRGRGRGRPQSRSVSRGRTPGRRSPSPRRGANRALSPGP